ncbi:MAG: penicillin-binding protein activator [Deltaproteobacteria bacterium]|nr:penicillin-binding protein activator [Deltaproteobacteria bacterium]
MNRLPKTESPSAPRRHSPLLAALAAAISLIVLAACVPPPGGSGRIYSGPGLGQDLAAQASAAYDRGDYSGAASLYRRWLSENPSGERREAILALSGLSNERLGRYKDAAGYYQSLLNEFPRTGYASAVKSRLPDLLILAGDASGALASAKRMAQAESDAQTKAKLRLSAGRAALLLGSNQEAAVAFIEAMAGAGPVRDTARQGLEAALSKLDQQSLYVMARQYGQNYPGPEAFWFYARAAALANDYPGLSERAAYFRRYFPRHPWLSALEAFAANPASAAGTPPPGAQFDPRPEARAVALASAPALPAQAPPGPSYGGAPGQILVGAILPLTIDQSAKFAGEILSGLRLALAPLGDKVAIIPLDTSGDAAKAQKLVTEAAANPGMLVLVGPLASREALAAAQTAQTYQMPLIAVSQRLGLTAGKPGVFRIFLTPKHQAEAVARYAVQNKGLRRLATLHPNDGYGQAMAGFFQAEVQRLGASVIQTAAYNPGSPDLAGAVSQLTGAGSIRRASTSYQAPVSFEAVFIPDSPGNIGQILPQMAYHDLTKMTYLGTPLWLTRELAQLGGRYMGNSVIPDAFNSLSQRREAGRFRNDYERAFGQEPDQFAAYGYDAGLAISAAIRKGAGTRAEMVRALSSGGPYPGATGPFSFDHEGEYRVQPMMLTVKDGAFVLLQEPSAAR